MLLIGVWLLCWQPRPVRTLYPRSLLSWLCLIRENIKPGPSPAQSVIPGVPIWCPVSLYWYRVIRSAQYQGLSGWNVVRECSQSEFSISEQWPIRGHVVWPECSVVMPPNYCPDIEECSIKERLPWVPQVWQKHDTSMTQISAFGKHQLQIKKHHQSLPDINSALTQTYQWVSPQSWGFCGSEIFPPDPKLGCKSVYWCSKARLRYHHPRPRRVT